MTYYWSNRRCQAYDDDRHLKLVRGEDLPPPEPLFHLEPRAPIALGWVMLWCAFTLGFLAGITLSLLI